MGNAMKCIPKELRGGGGVQQRRGDGGGGGGGGGAGSKSARRMEEEMLHRQALALAIQQHSQNIDSGSISRRGFGSASSRRRSDSFSSKQPPVFLDNIETKKFVLVHGEGFGAWCWYKTISLLEEAGAYPVALDLVGSGLDNTDPNKIETLADYSKPLIDYLNSLAEDEKVILVGHSSGGASISYVLEHFPKKISKAVFLCATMVSDGKRSYDVFADELASADVFMQESQFLLYGNGREKSPTTLVFDKQQMKALYFNQTPSKDVALSSVSMRPAPLAPFMEKLSLTPDNYGSVRRFFIQTLDDNLLSPDTQEKMIRENQPDGVFKIKGSDHCPFFSKPQSLNKILLEIANLGSDSSEKLYPMAAAIP